MLPDIVCSSVENMFAMFVINVDIVDIIEYGASVEIVLLVSSCMGGELAPVTVDSVDRKLSDFDVTTSNL